ncbi:hypothetical protein Ddye_022390 [Dipteronia dyeriana]|uniref:Uncharacterized protein n=1 Tax=Dipteronia dyeriana TaxID=168575 RepID=A0AAD9U3D0_9ROSI|nr:hypothetical protein Ddye_022390 [Dipteronia dyeriana]
MAQYSKNKILIRSKAWCVNNKTPDSLVARVLKGIYYPTSSFLKVDHKRRGSLIWNSLYWGRELLEEGSRWRVGSSTSIRIYDDRWLPRQVTFKVISLCVHEDIFLMSHLMTVSGGWNYPLIWELFLKEDVDMILSIPLSSTILDDSLT